MRHYLLAGADAYLRALDAVHRAHHVVRHTDAQPAVFQRGEDHHRPRLVRILAQVRQQIIEHALEIHRIRRDAAVADEVDARHVEPVVLQVELQFEHELVEQHPRVKLLHVHLKVGAAENKEILEQFVREILQLHGLAVAIWENHLIEQLWETDVELQAILKEKMITLGEIAKWDKGSFLPLDMYPHDDVTVLCGDVPLFTGSMGRKEENVVIKIQGKAEKNG